MKFFKNKKFLYTGLVVLVLILSILGGLIVGHVQKKDNKVSDEKFSKNEQTSVESKDNKELEKYSEIQKDTKRKNDNEIVNVEEGKSDKLNPLEKKNANSNLSKINNANYSKEYQDYLNLSEDEKEKVEVIPRKEEVNYDELAKIIEKENKITSEEPNKVINNKNDESNLEIPEKFDLRDIIEIKVGDQGIFGLCWDFASMKCVETNLALTQGKNYDFSEIHVDYLTSKLCSSDTYRNVHSGGNFEIFMDYVKKFNGFVLEEKLELEDYKEAEYRTFYNIDKVDECVYETVNFPSYNKDLGWTEEQFTEYQNTLKKHIMNFGSLYVAMESTEGLKHDADLYYYDRADWLSAKVQENDFSGHCMSIVGWDDNYPKENFISPTGKQPQNDGAYILLNSYGESYGMGGYLYVSYEDNMIHSSISGVISTNKKDLINLSEMDNKIIADYIKEQYPEDIIKIDNKDYINKIILKDVYVVDLSNRGLDTIKGIEVFEKLYSLNISNNNVKDISELENMKKLMELDISNNINIKGWEKTTTLNRLVAKNCGITDISPLKNYTRLSCLDLSENENIANLEILKELDKIYDLSLRKCNITDIGNVISHNIDTIDLSENKKLYNFEALNRCDYIYLIKLQDCDIDDVTKLNIKNMGKLSLDLSKNKGLKNLESLTNIENLILSDCNLTNVEVLGSLDNLVALDISNNNVKDITSLKQVLYLNVSGNVGVYGDLSDGKVESLYIENCNLTEDFNFFNIESLYQVCISGNNISLAKIIEKVNCQDISIDKVDYADLEKIPEGILVENATVYKSIKIPRRNVTIDGKELNYYYYNSRAECKNAVMNIRTGYISVEDGTDAQIILKNVHDLDNKLINATYVIRFEIDENIKPTGLVVTRLPNKTSYRTGEEFNFDGLEVSCVYENGIYVKADNYTVIPLTNLVQGMYMFHGNNTVKVIKDGMECEFHIKYLNTDNSVTLKFKTKEVYNEMLRYIKMIGKNEIISNSDEDKSIEITQYEMNHIKSMPFLPGIWDTSLIEYMLEDKEVLSLFADKKEVDFKYTGKKLELEDIEKIRGIFNNLNRIQINNKTDENSYEILSKPEDIEVVIFKEGEETLHL